MNSVRAQYTKSFVHFAKMVTQFLHIFPRLQTILVVRREHITKDVLVFFLYPICQTEHLAIHRLHLFLKQFPHMC